MKPKTPKQIEKQLYKAIEARKADDNFHNDPVKDYLTELNATFQDYESLINELTGRYQCDDDIIFNAEKLKFLSKYSCYCEEAINEYYGSMVETENIIDKLALTGYSKTASDVANLLGIDPEEIMY